METLTLSFLRVKEHVVGFLDDNVILIYSGWIPVGYCDREGNIMCFDLGFFWSCGAWWSEQNTV